jgi:hypothetical protein
MLRLCFCRILISCIALCIWISSTTTPEKINPTNTKSEGVKVSSNISTNSEIERLSGEVNKQQSKAEWWDAWNLRLLAVAGLIGVAIAISSLGFSRSNKKLTDLRGELDKAKDRALQSDLKAKDDAIAESQRETAQAQLEIERIKLPRRLSKEKQQAVASALASSAKLNFAFLVFNDPEAIDLMRDLNSSLQRVWKRVPTPPKLGGDTAINFDGSAVPIVNAEGLTVWVASDNGPGMQAASALAKAISSQGVPCESHSSEELKQYERGLAVIRVGKKVL